MRGMYHPVTASPFKCTNTYMELAPCDGLNPYIRCFWGSEKPYVKTDAFYDIVVPDTCVDIIYNIDYTDNKITGGFCGVNDSSFCVSDECNQGHLVSTFAIRFYAWGAYAFSQDSLKDTLNGFYDISSRFHWLDIELGQRLFEINSLSERVHFVENLFLNRLLKVRENNLINGVIDNIILNKGTLSVEQLAKDSFISIRQLERQFNEYIGITPKKLNNLVRYQLLWNDILRNPDFNVLDAVYKYGYTDQPHLMREFKRYHTMDIKKAIQYAYGNVENIQYFHGGY